MVAAATSPPIFTVIAIIHLLKVSTDAFISRNALGTGRYSRCLTLHEPCDTHMSRGLFITSSQRPVVEPGMLV